MINSFRRMRTGKPDGSGRKRTGDGEADGSGGSCSGCSAVRLFGRRGLSSPAWPAASGAKPPTAAGASSSSRIQQLSFSCAVVFAAVAYRRQRRGLSSPAWPEASGSEAPTAAGAAAELNFEMLIVVNNKFVDELAFVVFVFKNLGGTV